MMPAIKTKIVKLGAFYIPGIAPWKEGKRAYQFVGDPTTKKGHAKAAARKLAAAYTRTLIYAGV